MRNKRRRYLSGILFVIILTSTITLLSHFHDLESTSKVQFVWKAIYPTMKLFDNSTYDTRVFLSDLQVRGQKDTSTTCQFPRLSIYNDANKDKFEKMDPLKCSSSPDLFFLENGTLRMNRSALFSSTNQNIEKCEYLAVERVNDDFFTYTEPVTKTKPPFDIIIQHDFIQARCNLVNSEEEKDKLKKRSVDDRGGNETQTDVDDYYRHIWYDQYMFYEDGAENFDFDQLLVQVYPKPEVLTRKSTFKPDNGTGLNVLIIGSDSLSHMSFQRILPKTYSYLRDELDFTILNGYNIVGDGTTAALIPLLTGKTEMELPEVRKNVPNSGSLDQYPLLWKKFENHGYATLYAEDEPSINTFNLRLNGFERQPTDHYMRPFWQALWRSTIHDISPRFCTGSTPHHQYLLGYIKDFYIKYKNMPKFAFLFMCELTHWVNDPGQYMDSDLQAFLKWFKQTGELEKTVVIVMADHGGRYGKVRQSVQGKIEERLPMMSIRYPQHFIKKHPNLLKNLKINKERLVTAFDIHETLVDILDESRFTQRFASPPHRKTLAHEIRYDRTCKDAHIDFHWCSCLKRLQQDTDKEYVKRSAEELVSHINTLTLPVRKLCRKLKLKQIKSAYLMIPNEKVLKFMKEKDEDFRYANFSKDAVLDIAHYEVTIQTLPNDGVFESTAVVNFKDGSVKVNPEVSRLDHYGNQPSCIEKNYPDLRKFCFCKTYKRNEGG